METVLKKSLGDVDDDYTVYIEMDYFVQINQIVQETENPAKTFGKYFLYSYPGDFSLNFNLKGNILRSRFNTILFFFRWNSWLFLDQDQNWRQKLRIHRVDNMQQTACQYLNPKKTLHDFFQETIID